MGKYIKLFDAHSDYVSFTGGTAFVKPNVSYCQQENEVHYTPIPDPFNGHEYVDLGLPSGTLWATTNIGATNPEDYGDYFAWGETEPKSNYSWSTYKFNPSGDGSTMTKYNETDGLTQLEPEDDAAHVLWGGDWHMPTKEQCDELFNTTYVTNAWVTNYNGSGVNGRLFTSVSNGNTMFVPAGGGYGYGEDGNVGGFGYVWSSAFNSHIVVNAWSFYFSSYEASVNDALYRYYGQSVRGVISNS